MGCHRVRSCQGLLLQVLVNLAERYIVLVASSESHVDLGDLVQGLGLSGGRNWCCRLNQLGLVHVRVSLGLLKLLGLFTMRRLLHTVASPDTLTIEVLLSLACSSLCQISEQLHTALFVCFLAALDWLGVVGVHALLGLHWPTELAKLVDAQLLGGERLGRQSSRLKVLRCAGLKLTARVVALMSQELLRRNSYIVPVLVNDELALRRLRQLLRRLLRLGLLQD